MTATSTKVIDLRDVREKIDSLDREGLAAILTEKFSSVGHSLANDKDCHKLASKILTKNEANKLKQRNEVSTSETSMKKGENTLAIKKLNKADSHAKAGKQF